MDEQLLMDRRQVARDRCAEAWETFEAWSVQPNKSAPVARSLRAIVLAIVEAEREDARLSQPVC